MIPPMKKAAMGPGEMDMKMEPTDGESGNSNQALIEALEQARSALDAVEAAAVQDRRAKPKEPSPLEAMGETAGADDEQE